MITMKSANLGRQLPKFIDPPQMDGDNKAPAIGTALDAVHQLKSDGECCRVSTLHFLTVCNAAVIIFDKIGPTMRVLRQDLQQNIERLQMMYKTNPSLFSNLMEMAKKETEEGSARKPLSCTRAVLWLTRSMDFAMIFLSKLVEDANMGLIQIIEESYNMTLQPWHGWISSAAYKDRRSIWLCPSAAEGSTMEMVLYQMMEHSVVALKLIPERKVLMNLIMEEREDHEAIKEEINSLVSSFTPILNEIHAFLATLRLDRLKSS